MFADRIHVGYEGRKIIRDLTVHLPDGKVTAVIGPNGCGKSTLLKGMSRLLSVSEGAVILDGKSIHSENSRTLARKFAVLPQTPEGAAGITAEQLVALGRFPHQHFLGGMSEQDHAVITRALTMTGTLALRHQPVDQLSGGQRQRVWIAMALAQDTEMIFLDEPTTYLDMSHQLEVLELLRGLNQQQMRTVVMVLHDLNQAARFADHIIAMKDGAVFAQGTPEDVMTPSLFRDVFHIDAVIGRDPMAGTPMCLSYQLLRKEEICQ